MTKKKFSAQNGKDFGRNSVTRQVTPGDICRNRHPENMWPQRGLLKRLCSASPDEFQ